jgi:hypothetical protein
MKPGIFWAASSATRLCPEEFRNTGIKHDFSCDEDVRNSDHVLFYTQILKNRNFSQLPGHQMALKMLLEGSATATRKSSLKYQLCEI